METKISNQKTNKIKPKKPKQNDRKILLNSFCVDQLLLSM